MKHKPLPVIVFLTLMLSSLLAGRHSYCTAKEELTADLNQALALIVKEKTRPVITQDTIRTYKQLRKVSGGKVLIAVADERFCRYLKNKRLKESAFLTFDVVDNQYTGHTTDGPAICSDTLIIEDPTLQETLALKGYTRLSAAAVFGLSDQRLSAGLMIAAFLWGIFVRLSLRRTKKEVEMQVESIGFGGLVYSETDNCFYNANHDLIHFTPMQEQLIRMFWDAPSHTLTKEEICTALWPKKDDANDTLYTLIRRLKAIIERHTNLKIVADRGKSYSLEIKEPEN